MRVEGELGALGVRRLGRRRGLAQSSDAACGGPSKQLPRAFATMSSSEELAARVAQLSAELSALLPRQQEAVAAQLKQTRDAEGSLQAREETLKLREQELAAKESALTARTQTLASAYADNEQ
eukprot:2669414-Prymnesium_polylepis.1